jgi:hypothetical protein
MPSPHRIGPGQGQGYQMQQIPPERQGNRPLAMPIAGVDRLANQPTVCIPCPAAETRIDLCSTRSRTSITRMARTRLMTWNTTSIRTTLSHTTSLFTNLSTNLLPYKAITIPTILTTKTLGQCSITIHTRSTVLRRRHGRFNLLAAGRR